MNSITGRHLRVGWHRPEAASCRHSHHLSFRRRTHHSSFPFSPGLCICIPCRPLIVGAQKRAPKSDPILKSSIADEEAFTSDEEDDLLIDEFEGGYVKLEP
ncbi:unnamed protein product [Cuscuta campestris]|uniref:Uncharacterized protein n=1 Tax=Cuscuta campestris TaxID=132261 RepID=A0A484NH25_9ASTE|nr:unnamed protein product [Cuscuta campestris]